MRGIVPDSGLQVRDITFPVQDSICRGLVLFCGYWIFLLVLVVQMISGSALGGAPPLDPQPAFDAANKLYEQGHYREAAAAYQGLIQGGMVSPGLYFNLGNAWFKAGQKGRAIASYLIGLRLRPRDPSLRFNLQFVRQEVTGRERPPETWWQRWLAGLTINEWTLLCATAFWVWLALLSLREVRVEWRKSLRGYTALAGLSAILLLVCLDRATAQRKVLPAVVVAPEAVVRYGPLDESQVDFQLHDGMEVIVLDDKPGPQSWFLVRDVTGREGWLKQDEVILWSEKEL
jgi:hypothetical protein